MPSTELLKKYWRRIIWRLNAALWLLTTSKIEVLILEKKIKFYIRDRNCPLWKIWDLKKKPNDQDIPDLSVIKSLASKNKETVFFDIGAYIGLYSLYVSKLSSNNTIYSFEPDQKVKKLFEKNILLNKCKNIQVFDYAIADVDGAVRFVASSDSKSHISDNIENSISVNSISLDTFTKKIGKQPTIIKIDAEGYEVEIFKGGKQTLNNPNTWVFIELHSSELTQRGLLDSFINDLLSLNRPIYCMDGKKATSLDLRKGGHYVLKGL